MGFHLCRCQLPRVTPDSLSSPFSRAQDATQTASSSLPSCGHVRHPCKNSLMTPSTMYAWLSPEAQECTLTANTLHPRRCLGAWMDPTLTPVTGRHLWVHWQLAPAAVSLHTAIQTPIMSLPGWETAATWVCADSQGPPATTEPAGSLALWWQPQPLPLCESAPGPCRYTSICSQAPAIEHVHTPHSWLSRSLALGVLLWTPAPLTATVDPPRLPWKESHSAQCVAPSCLSWWDITPSLAGTPFTPLFLVPCTPRLESQCSPNPGECLSLLKSVHKFWKNSSNAQTPTQGYRDQENQENLTPPKEHDKLPG